MQKTNHTDKSCYFRKNKNKKNEEEEKVSFLASKMETEDVWIVDSGTTTNMTNKYDRIKITRR